MCTSDAEGSARAAWPAAPYVHAGAGALRSIMRWCSINGLRGDWCAARGAAPDKGARSLDLELGRLGLGRRCVLCLDACAMVGTMLGCPRCAGTVCGAARPRAAPRSLELQLPLLSRRAAAVDAGRQAERRGWARRGARAARPKPARAGGRAASPRARRPLAGLHLLHAQRARLHRQPVERAAPPHLARGGSSSAFTFSTRSERPCTTSPWIPSTALSASGTLS